MVVLHKGWRGARALTRYLLRGSVLLARGRFQTRYHSGPSIVKRHTHLLPMWSDPLGVDRIRMAPALRGKRPGPQPFLAVRMVAHHAAALVPWWYGKGI